MWLQTNAVPTLLFINAISHNFKRRTYFSFWYCDGNILIKHGHQIHCANNKKLAFHSSTLYSFGWKDIVTKSSGIISIKMRALNWRPQTQSIKIEMSFQWQCHPIHCFHFQLYVSRKFFFGSSFLRSDSHSHTAYFCTVIIIIIFFFLFFLSIKLINLLLTLCRLLIVSGK